MPTTMTTTITGFHLDAQRDWIAELACGHSQHVRHRPPWQNRPWVETESGRAEKIGAAIECPLCEMPALPEGAREYKRTTVFTEATVPSGLLHEHRTKPGVWARIVVEAGELEYRLQGAGGVFVLTPDVPGIVPPTVPHQVRPVSAVRFHVEFLRTDGENA